MDPDLSDRPRPIGYGRPGHPSADAVGERVAAAVKVAVGLTWSAVAVGLACRGLSSGAEVTCVVVLAAVGLAQIVSGTLGLVGRRP